MVSVFSQQNYLVRLEWGREGVGLLAADCRVVVIVDVLSFCTAVDVAVTRGAAVLPLAWREPAAVPEGAVLAGRRGSSSWSLSPSSLLDIPAGTRLALPSPNGATLSVSAATHGATVLAACLRNASAVATAALACRADGAIGVVPAGERWPGDGLRPAIEDLLGAGAVVAALARHGVGPCSPEALAAADAFEAALRRGLADALVACSSGRELAVGGFGADVALAAERDVSGAAPVLDNGESGLCYGAFSAGAR